jgi:RNA polymerase sigma-70 factor (ECF subfamily)
MQRLDIDKEGEKSSDEIYRRLSPIILSYLCQHVSTQQDAEDLLFDVFMAALKHEDFIHFPESRQMAWLQQVAKNKVIDHYRHLKLIPMLPLEIAAQVEDPALTPEQQVEQQEKYTQLAQALAQLSPSQQHLIQLRYGQGLRLMTIAAMLDKPEGTVRKWLARTLKKLRIHIDELRERRV